MASCTGNTAKLAGQAHSLSRTEYFTQTQLKIRHQSRTKIRIFLAFDKPKSTNSSHFYGSDSGAFSDRGAMLQNRPNGAKS